MSEFREPYKEHPLTNMAFPVRIHHNNASFTFPPHYHNELEILYVNRGHMVMEVNHIQYHLNDGDMIIVGSNHIHAYLTDREEIDYFLLLFDWNQLEEIFRNLKIQITSTTLLFQWMHFGKTVLIIMAMDL